MYVRVNYQIVKNFLSYGNSETKLEFESGLSLVTAKNGGGKSTLFLDAVSYNLYGKPYRNIKIAELVNRKNGKGLYTEGSYTIDGKDTYRIIRTHAPQKLEIYKNEETVPLFYMKNYRCFLLKVCTLCAPCECAFSVFVDICVPYLLRCQ